MKRQEVRNLTTERDACHDEVARLREQIGDAVRLLRETANEKEAPRIVIGAVGEAYRDAAKILIDATESWDEGF